MTCHAFLPSSMFGDMCSCKQSRSYSRRVPYIGSTAHATVRVWNVCVPDVDRLTGQQVYSSRITKYSCAAQIYTRGTRNCDPANGVISPKPLLLISIIKRCVYVYACMCAYEFVCKDITLPSEIKMYAPHMAKPRSTIRPSMYVLTSMYVVPHLVPHMLNPK